MPPSGRIAFRAGELRQDARPWYLLTLQRRVEHEVDALEESVVVLTITFEGYDAPDGGQQSRSEVQQAHRAVVEVGERDRQ